MTKNLRIEFYGRRKIGSFRRKLYIISGVIELSGGVFGLFYMKPSSVLFLLSFVLLISGVGYIVVALVNINLMKERNYLQIQQGNIEFKNSCRKPQSVDIEALSDVIVDGQKVAFVKKDDVIITYDFSVFPCDTSNEIACLLQKLQKDIHKNLGMCV